MPLCLFPTQAHYSGMGDVNSAANWSCAANQDLLQVGADGAAAGLEGPAAPAEGRGCEEEAER
jgi:feruloyl esterase